MSIRAFLPQFDQIIYRMWCVLYFECWHCAIPTLESPTSPVPFISRPLHPINSIYQAGARWVFGINWKRFCLAIYMTVPAISHWPTLKIEWRVCREQTMQNHAICKMGTKPQMWGHPPQPFTRPENERAKTLVQLNFAYFINGLVFHWNCSDSARKHYILFMSRRLRSWMRFRTQI